MAERKIFSDLEFRKASEADQRNCIVRKGLGIELRGTGGKSVADGKPGDPITFVMSTADVDRYKDTIEVAGWILEDFKRNGAMPYCHNTWGLPVGKWLDPRITDKALLAEGVFCTGDMNPMGPSVELMYRGGFLNAVSVGFIPLEYTYDEDRKGSWGPAINFKKQLLTECSPVLVPANPEALVQGRSVESNPLVRAKAAGIDVRPFIVHLERTLDELAGPHLHIPADQAAALRRALGGGTFHSLPAAAPEKVEPPVATKTITLLITGDEKKLEKALEQFTKKAKDHGVEISVSKGGATHKMSAGQLEHFEKAEKSVAAAQECMKSMRALHEGEDPPAEDPKDPPAEDPKEPDDDDKKALEEIAALRKQVADIMQTATGKPPDVTPAK